MSEPIELSPEEDAVRLECLAKLKRTCTMPCRVVVTQDGETYTATAIAQLDPRSVRGEQGRHQPGPGGSAPERPVHRKSAPSALAALTGLRDELF